MFLKQNLIRLSLSIFFIFAVFISTNLLKLEDYKASAQTTFTCSQFPCYLDTGQSLTINLPSEWGEPSYIISSSGNHKRLFIPINSATEWARFKIHYPTSVISQLNVDVCSSKENVTFFYNGSPVTYNTISRGGKCWLDRNLGASRVCTAANDNQCYGDYFQWGRFSDGHQVPNSTVISDLSSSDNPNHSSFIYNPSYSDWRSPGNDSLWQGVTGINNPCPTGWRPPTDVELEAERLSWLTNDVQGAFNSSLKISAAGYRTGTFNNLGWGGFLLTSTATAGGAKFLNITPTSAIVVEYQSRFIGGSVRCIKSNSDYYRLIYDSTSGGSISGQANQVIIKNGSGSTVEAIANVGYQFIQWSDNSTQNPRTDVGVIEDKSVVAIFTPAFNCGDSVSFSYNSPISPCEAYGGTVTEVGGYRIHTFTTNSPFILNNNCNVSALVVAGGGGGGGVMGGGGGAGGFVYQSSLALNAQTYNVYVGSGGAGGINQKPGAIGGNSQFHTVVANGGGGGGHYYNGAGSSGGSGGGGGTYTGSYGSGISGQGNSGGEACNGNYFSGGGGGAGGAGENAPCNRTGNGGAGLASSITGSQIYYAGGGGAGGYGATTGGNGGIGGGGSGGASCQSGMANTGGGGGGGNYNSTTGLGSGCAGGSGVVIISYPIGSVETYGTVFRGGKCWLDRNLGASRACVSVDDSSCFGHLFQWGRSDDGHQIRTSLSTSTPSSLDNPGHPRFITNNIVGDYNWRNPSKNSLWQGVSGINNPCPFGWRVPTIEELQAEMLSFSSNDLSGAFNSTLKWPDNKVRQINGDLYSQFTGGYVWSSTTGPSGYSNYSLYLRLGSTYADIQNYGRALGQAVRCIRD